MKRSQELSSLSREHHQALGAALKLRRATLDDAEAALAAFASFWREHGAGHFETEERVLLGFLTAAEADRLLTEHDAIRARVDELAGPSGARRLETTRELGEILHDHVRFEERVLFPALERRLTPAQLDALGRALARADAA